MLTCPDVFYAILTKAMYIQLEEKVSICSYFSKTKKKKVPQDSSLHSQRTLFARDTSAKINWSTVWSKTTIWMDHVSGLSHQRCSSLPSVKALQVSETRGERESQADQTLNNFHLWLHSFSLWSVHFSTPAYWSGRFSPPWSLQLTHWLTWEPPHPILSRSSIPLPSPTAPRVIVRSL